MRRPVAFMRVRILDDGVDGTFKRKWRADELDRQCTLRSSSGPAALCTPLFEKMQVDSVRHSLIPRVIGMNVVAGIVGGVQSAWLVRVPHGGVKIDDAIEVMTRTNPGVDSLALPFPFGCVEVGINSTLEGQQGSTEDLCATSVDAFDDLQHA